MNSFEKAREKVRLENWKKFQAEEPACLGFHGGFLCIGKYCKVSKCLFID